MTFCLSAAALRLLGTSVSPPHCASCCMGAGRDCARTCRYLWSNVFLPPDSTDNILNTLIVQAINRGAVTRCFLEFCRGWVVEADTLASQLMCIVILDPCAQLSATRHLFYSWRRWTSYSSWQRLTIYTCKCNLSLSTHNLYPCRSSMIPYIPISQRTVFCLIQLLVLVNSTNISL
jgi:hypothetical protein